jgi:type II secretory pathway pseudopilin PulG
MKRRDRSSGFTLVELIIACALSTIVLVGVMEMMSSMVMTEVDSMRKGSVTAWGLANINAMSADIAGASYLSRPVSGATDTTLIVCSNWSAAKNGPLGNAGSPGELNLDPDPLKRNIVSYYCWDTGEAGTMYQNSLLHASVVQACPTPGTAAPACTHTSAPYSNGIGDCLVATGVYQFDYPAAYGAIPIFTGDPFVQNAVHLQFRVGLPAAGVSAGSNLQTKSTNPQSLEFNSRLVLEAASP